MTWPAAIIIDVVFLALYAISSVVTLLNVIKHGHGKKVGFVSLFLFSIVRIVGNAIIVYEYTHGYPSITATIWGYVLQSIGLSFLLTSVVGLYERANALRAKEDSRHAQVSRLINLVNIAALVCIIVGYNQVDYTAATSTSGTGLSKFQLPVETKVGGVLYIVLVLFVSLLILVAFRHLGNNRESRTILRTLLVVLPFLLARAAYTTYAIFSGSVLVTSNIWLRLVFQYITEFAALVILSSLGFTLSRYDASVDGAPRTTQDEEFAAYPPPRFPPPTENESKSSY